MTRFPPDTPPDESGRKEISSSKSRRLVHSQAGDVGVSLCMGAPLHA